MNATTVTVPPPLDLENEPKPSLTVLRRFLRTRFTAISIAIIVLIVLCAIFAPVISPYDPVTQQDYANANQGPTGLHWLGTDYLGRDILSRVIYGARISLLVGAVSVGIGLLAGVVLGVAAGYAGGKTDSVLMRLSDVIWAFPSLMLALAITAALGRGVTNAMIAIGVVNIPFFARLARASTLSVRELDYVTAARAIGTSGPRVILRHVLPNIVAPLIVQASLACGVAMTTEASLDFLGVGVQPPTPSWGVDLQVGYQYLANNPSLAIFPGLAIFVAVLAFNFLGDGLRIALDPRLSRRY
jgi:ABC-type dipeptide/oligopeptide/nickel transport system permease subunit